MSKVEKKLKKEEKKINDLHNLFFKDHDTKALFNDLKEFLNSNPNLNPKENSYKKVGELIVTNAHQEALLKDVREFQLSDRHITDLHHLNSMVVNLLNDIYRHKINKKKEYIETSVLQEFKDYLDNCHRVMISMYVLLRPFNQPLKSKKID